MAPWPRALTNRFTGAAVSATAYRAALATLRTALTAGATATPRVRQATDLRGQLAVLLSVANEAPLVEALSLLPVWCAWRGMPLVDDALDDVAFYAEQSAEAEGRVWTPILEALFRPAPRGGQTFRWPVATTGRLWHRLAAWVQATGAAAIDALAPTQIPAVQRLLATHVPIPTLSVAQRWQLLAVGGAETARALWRNASWPVADRRTFLADALTRLATGAGMPGHPEIPGGEALVEPLAAETIRLTDFIFAAWNDQPLWPTMAPTPDDPTTAATTDALAKAWVAAITRGAFDATDFAPSIATALFIHPHTPVAVLEAAIAHWAGTGSEVPTTWLSHPAVPVAYVRAVVARHVTLPEHLAEAVVRHEAVLRDPAVRRVLQKSRARGVWAALWRTVAPADRATILDGYLAHDPRRALQAMAAEPPEVRPPVTRRRIATLLGHRDPGVRSATLTLLVPGGEAPDVPPAPRRRRSR